MAAMSDSHDWLVNLSRLHIDRAHGPAPHKPFLLLVLCDLAEEGLLASPFTLTPEVASRFFSYWRIVAYRRRQRPDIRLPFFHLHTDGILTPLDGDGHPTGNRDAARLAQIPSDFVQFLEDPNSRRRRRRMLIANYFPPSEQIALYEAVGLPAPSDLELEENATYTTRSEARQAGREARFRTGVVAAYDYTCALTGYRLVTIEAGSIVDAAHIHALKDSRNNDLQNGLALSKTRIGFLTRDCGLSQTISACSLRRAAFPNRGKMAGPCFSAWLGGQFGYLRASHIGPAAYT